jgi:phage/plasmid-associated DNA primase
MIENFELTEFYDKSKLLALINSNILRDDFVDESDEKYRHSLNDRQQLQWIYDNLDINSSLKVLYSRKNGIGRFYVKTKASYTLLPRRYRNALCEHLCYDRDMKNAHLSILYEQIIKYNLTGCKNIKNFYEKYEQISYSIMNAFSFVIEPKAQFKKMMLSILFGFGCHNQFEKILKKYNIDKKSSIYVNNINIFNFIKKYIEELKNATQQLQQLNIYQIDTSHKDFNEDGSWLSFFIQTIEAEIIVGLKEYLNHNINGIVLTYEYDGLKLVKHLVDEYGFDEIDKLIEQFLKQNNHNFISIVNKCMDEKICLDEEEIINIESVVICETESPSPTTITQTFSPIIIETQQPPLPILEQTDYEERNDERVARTFLKFYGDLFIYEMESHKTYFYNGVYWEQNEFKIKIYLCENLLEKYQKQYDILYDEGKKINRDNEVEYKRHQFILKQIANFITSLSTISHLKNYEDMIQTLIARKVEFDVNPYLFAFDNVIWDLRQNKIIEPHPSQMISMTTGYNFEFMPIDTLNEKKKILMNVLKEIFPDDDIREYDLIVKSSGLTGIQVQNLIVSSGVGGNGKSIFNALMMKSLGNYGYNLSSTCLVQEIKTGPNPEFANLHNKRYVVSGEPPSKKYINMDTIKKLTGDKILEVRGLYQSKCETKLKCTLDLDLNGLPKFDVVDEAVNRRLRAIPFESRFVDESRYELLKDKPNIFKMNPIYKEDEFQNEYRQILFMILMDYLPKFLETGLLPNPPEKCKNLSNTMLANSDDLFDWFSNTFERNDDSILSFGDIYDTYKTSSYFTNLSKKSQREQNRSKFITMIENNLFLKDCIKRRKQFHDGKQLTRDVLVGWILKKDDADDEEN